MKINEKNTNDKLNKLSKLSRELHKICNSTRIGHDGCPKRKGAFLTEDDEIYNALKNVEDYLREMGKWRDTSG